MEDSAIVDLYWQRNEEAIRETENKYGHYLTKISRNILSDPEDSKESVNDTYLKAWNSMPPHRPNVLSTYLGKITRQLSIDIFRKKKSEKRKGSEYALSLSELDECVSFGSTPEKDMDLQLLAGAINIFLRSLPDEARNAFIRRYYFLDSIREIAVSQKMSESKLKSMLYRTRISLKQYLEKEGFLL